MTHTSTFNDSLVRGVPVEWRGQRLLIKIGGEVALNSPGLDSVMSQVAVLVSHGVEVVVVHGGGPQADALAARLGHTVRKVAGRRVTDDDALEVAKLVYGGSINVDLLATLGRHGARGVGLSGVDAGLVQVARRPPVLIHASQTDMEEWVDFGHVGDVVSVDVSLLELLLEQGYTPVVASLAADKEGKIYNVNADTVAQALAVALGVSRLVLLTNVPGIMRDPADHATLLPTCTASELEALVAVGAITGGMLPKVRNCIEALAAGVGSVQVLNGALDRPPLLESLHGGAGIGVGTLITKD
ncbi:MAG: acetylglutamate kinase [Chloroflexia bacterium]